MEKKILGMQVENKINVGDILTMLGIFGAVVVLSFGVWKELYEKASVNDKRIVIVERDIVFIHKQANRDRKHIREDLRDIKLIVKEVSSSLNKKADR